MQTREIAAHKLADMQARKRKNMRMEELALPSSGIWTARIIWSIYDEETEEEIFEHRPFAGRTVAMEMIWGMRVESQDTPVWIEIDIPKGHKRSVTQMLRRMSLLNNLFRDGAPDYITKEEFALAAGLSEPFGRHEIEDLITEMEDYGLIKYDQVLRSAYRDQSCTEDELMAWYNAEWPNKGKEHFGITGWLEGPLWQS